MWIRELETFFDFLEPNFFGQNIVNNGALKVAEWCRLLSKVSKINELFSVLHSIQFCLRLSLEKNSNRAAFDYLVFIRTHLLKPLLNEERERRFAWEWVGKKRLSKFITQTKLEFLSHHSIFMTLKSFRHITTKIVWSFG